MFINRLGFIRISENSWDMKKDGGQEDQKNIVYNDDMEQDEINDLNEDLLHLRNGLGDNVNNTNNKLEYIKQGGIFKKYEGQGNHFGNANNSPQTHYEHFGGANNNNHDDNDNNNDNNKNQNHGGNNQNQVSEDNADGNASYDDYNVYDGDSEDNHQDNCDSSGGWDHDPEDEEHEDGNVDEPGDNGQDTNDIKQVEEDTGAGRRRNRRSMIRALPSASNGTRLTDLIGIKGILTYVLHYQQWW